MMKLIGTDTYKIKIRIILDNSVSFFIIKRNEGLNLHAAIDLIKDVIYQSCGPDLPDKKILG